MQKSHNLKIRKSKFGFAKSILSDINPVGPRWVQVSAEFSIKNHQTRINLYSIYAIFYYAQEYSNPNFTRLGASRPARDSLLAWTLRAQARAAYSRLRRSSPVFPPLPCGNSKIHTAICSADLPRQPIPPDRASAPARLYPDGCLESTPRPRAIISTKCAG